MSPTAALASSPTDAPTIIPTQADYSKKQSRPSAVDIGNKQDRGLREEQSQDDVELTWAKEQRRLKEREAMQDKFATLFEPPTPRASPTILPSSLPQVAAATVSLNLPLFDHSPQSTLTHRSSRIFRPRDSSSDFGSFVGAAEDPLSFALAYGHPGEGSSTAGDATPSAANTGKLCVLSTHIVI
jgi:hypothetical protein